MNMPEKPGVESLVAIRKKLHARPELSGKEHFTSRYIENILEELQPDSLSKNIGGQGVAAIFKGREPGPRIMVRSELDALPIKESNNFEHRSKVDGVSHKCGHDGHMAIAIGVARYFSINRPSKGELMVLFQPSEENGEGAGKVMSDPFMNENRPDFVLALHNLPGYPLNRVVLRNGVFASASKGMIVRLKGKTSHAAEPENGLSPAMAVSDIIRELMLLQNEPIFRSFVLLTIIHVRIGEIAFGTTPGEAVVMATLRAFENNEMELLSEKAVDIVERNARLYGLRCDISWTEEFYATENDVRINKVVEDVAEKNDLKVTHLQKPFKWSEDFSCFTREIPGVLFGLGAGENHPELHNPDYDFPDELIEAGVKMFTGTFEKLLIKSFKWQKLLS